MPLNRDHIKGCAGLVAEQSAEQHVHSDKAHFESKLQSHDGLLPACLETLFSLFTRTLMRGSLAPVRVPPRHGVGALGVVDGSNGALFVPGARLQCRVP